MNATNYVTNFQFVGSTIKKLTIQNDFIIFDECDEQIQRALDVDYDICGIEQAEKDNVLTGVLNLSVIIDLKKEEMSAHIELCVQGCFTSEHPTNETALKDTLCTNGSAVLYSIARGIIMNISSQAFNSGCIHLPMLNMIALKEQKEKTE